MGASDERAFLAQQIALRLVKEVARTLDDAGVPAMPIKGALLAGTVYRGRIGRAFVDVDLLVAPGGAERARRALEAAGHREWAHAIHARSFAHPRHPIPLDLHHRPFPPLLFRLDAGALFARARRDTEAFGAPLWLPSPQDTYALAIGAFAKSRHGKGERARLDDLAAIAAFHELDSRATARHLEGVGMRRAARRVLALTPNEPFARDVIAALGADPVGEVAAALAGRWADHAPGPAPFSAPTPHLLNHSLRRGALSAAVHVARSARAAWVRRQRTAAP